MVGELGRQLQTLWGDFVKSIKNTYTFRRWRAVLLEYNWQLLAAFLAFTSVLRGGSFALLPNSMDGQAYEPFARMASPWVWGLVFAVLGSGLTVAIHRDENSSATMWSFLLSCWWGYHAWMFLLAADPPVYGGFVNAALFSAGHGLVVIRAWRDADDGVGPWN